MESIPRLGARMDRLTAIEGQPTDLANLPTGCAFAARCPSVAARCREASPPLFRTESHRAVSCYLHGSAPAISSESLGSVFAEPAGPRRAGARGD